MDSYGLLCLLIIGGGVIVAYMSAQAQAKTREAARQAYITSLGQLKSDPTNPDLKQQTLALGRTYSNLTRNKTGVALFDEVAVMNDINAATAGATAGAAAIASAMTPAPALSAAPASASIEERLAKLTSLKTQGMITEDEYNTKRQKIMDEI